MKEKVMREIYFAKRQAHSAEWAMPLSFHERFQATTVEPLENIQMRLLVTVQVEGVWKIHWRWALTIKVM